MQINIEETFLFFFFGNSPGFLRCGAGRLMAPRFLLLLLLLCLSGWYRRFWGASEGATGRQSCATLTARLLTAEGFLFLPRRTNALLCLGEVPRALLFISPALSTPTPRRRPSHHIVLYGGPAGRMWDCGWLPFFCHHPLCAIHFVPPTAFVPPGAPSVTEEPRTENAVLFLATRTDDSTLL